MTGVGEFLKGHREQKGIRLEEIASITKIHIHHLELIERESWKDLPPEPFLRGFLTAYAKYVGADTREVLSKFYEGRGIATVEPTEVPPMDARTDNTGARTRSMNPSRLIEQAEPFPFGKVMMGLGMVLLVAVVGTLITIGKKESTPEPVAGTTTTTTSSAVANTTTGTTPALTASVAAVDTKPLETKPVTMDTKPAAAETTLVSPVASAPAVPVKIEAAPVVAELKSKPAETKPTVAGEFKHELTVQTQKKTWYKIVIDGSAPVQAMTRDNEKLTFKAKEKIKLVLGNPSGAKVAHNGKEVEGTKFNGTIRYFKFPAGAKFPQDNPKPRAVSSSDSEGSPSESQHDSPAPPSQKTIGDWLDSPKPETQTQ